MFGDRGTSPSTSARDAARRLVKMILGIEGGCNDPALSAFSGTSSGGGFYFRWHGLGIAVDPGMGSITSMHEHQIFIDDIDVIIVTHAHVDHNADVRGLTSLLYEFNKERERGAKLYWAKDRDDRLEALLKDLDARDSRV